ASTNINGNTLKQVSTFTMDSETRDIADAWLNYASANTVYDGEYTLDPDVMCLPDLRGYGTAPDLHIAMSLDETLKGMVSDLAEATTEELFDPDFDLRGRITDILYRWAGAEGADPDGRGDYIDGRQMATLEKFMGVAFWNDPDSEPGIAATYAEDA